jgi:hypothetical protein
MNELQSPSGLARLAVRRYARQLLHNPTSVPVHLARLNAALELPGTEPVQGALADLFASFDAIDASLKRMALQLVVERLPAHTVRWFEAQVAHARLAQVSPLATRWSVLARTSADISTRARRCSPDDSRALAAEVVRAVGEQDVPVQQAFLHHCVTCHDNLAFMLARRALLQTGASLPTGWEIVSRQLEQPQVFA